MRNISLLLILLAIVLPKVTLANENENTENELKYKIKDNIIYINNIPVGFNSSSEENANQNETVLDERDQKIMDIWKEKQTFQWNSLPTDKFTINASAYTAAADECGKSDGVTASGVKVQENRTLACPPQYPFGAKIQIDGYGLYTCEDRGGAIKGNKFDIYMETKSEAFAFGRQNLTAQVIF